MEFCFLVGAKRRIIQPPNGVPQYDESQSWRKERSLRCLGARLLEIKPKNGGGLNRDTQRELAVMMMKSKHQIKERSDGSGNGQNCTGAQGILILCVRSQRILHRSIRIRLAFVINVRMVIFLLGS